MKVKLQKAFDSVHWEFILDILVGLQFLGMFISWIKKYITTTSFSLAINEGIHGYFHSGRGIKQGDPLSSYLFGIDMEYMVRMV